MKVIYLLQDKPGLEEQNSVTEPSISSRIIWWDADTSLQAAVLQHCVTQSWCHTPLKSWSNKKISMEDLWKNGYSQCLLHFACGSSQNAIDDYFCIYFRASVRSHQISPLQVISLSHPFLSPFPRHMPRVTCSWSNPGWWIPLATFAMDLLRSIITSYKKMREIAWLKWELKLRQYTKCCKECKILFMEWCLLLPKHNPTTQTFTWSNKIPLNEMI